MSIMVFNYIKVPKNPLIPETFIFILDYTIHLETAVNHRSKPTRTLEILDQMLINKWSGHRVRSWRHWPRSFTFIWLLFFPAGLSWGRGFLLFPIENWMFWCRWDPYFHSAWGITELYKANTDRVFELLKVFE